MIRHYYTLTKIAESISTLCGWEINSCFSQDKDALIISFSSGSTERFLIFQSDPRHCCLYIADDYRRAGKNTIDLFQEIIGETLQEARILENNRIICLSFIHTDIYIYLFGAKKSNLYIVNKSGYIIGQLNKAANDVSSHLSIPEVQAKELDDYPEETKFTKALANCSFLLGPHYAAEFIERNGLNPETKIGDYDKQQLSDIKEKLAGFRELCLNSTKFYILENENGERILSLMELAAYPKIRNEYSEINEGVRSRFIDLMRTAGVDTAKKSILSKLKQSEKKLAKSVEDSKYFEEMLEKASQYRLFGEILMAREQVKIKAGSEIKVLDWEMNELTIALDPKLNIWQNAEKYYDKASSMLKTVEYRKKRLPKIQEELSEIRDKISEIEKSQSKKEINVIMEDSELQNIGGQSDKSDRSGKFRRFDLGDGYILYVGKSASNNDELTMKFAKPNDIWMHARGAGGSHCVLKMPSSDKAPKQILIRAGEIAAYYSQARKAKYVHVAYTRKKYVRKPKGAATGSVTIDREDVIMVEPRLPTED